MELIYHKTDARRGNRSPIDVAIVDMIPGAPLRIACPYLDLAYLERLVGHCDGRWQLLTDMDAWLRSVDLLARMRALNYVKRHMGSVRDCRWLHAKVVIGKGKAIIGSANLTQMGVRKRPEMCVLIDEADSVAEVTEWFDWLWSNSPVVDLKEFYHYAKELPDRRNVGDTDVGVRPPPAGPVIDSTLVRLPAPRGPKKQLTDKQREEMRTKYKEGLLKRLARRASQLDEYDEKSPCNTVFPSIDERFHFEIRVALVANSPNKLALAVVFHANEPEANKQIRELDRNKEQIIKALGLSDEITWRTGKLRKNRRIWVEREEDVMTEPKWSQHQWLIDSLVVFHDVFTKQLKRIRL